MSSTIKLNRGFDIRLIGTAEKIISSEVNPVRFAVKPVDFPGLTPKLNVKTGDKVLAGSPLFHDKLRPQILFTSPVSGKVTALNRGDQRKLLEIVIEKDGDNFIDFGKQDQARLNRELIKNIMLISGLWPLVRQRPYHVIADPSDVPKSIFISGFDTGPLAPDYNFILENHSNLYFKTGISVLKKLTNGKIHLILNGKGETSDLLRNIPEVEISYFSGPHPAGNVGIHIHHLDPINKGEIVWFVNLPDILTIGRLFEEGIYKPEKIIALTGSEVLNTRYYRIRSGASVSVLVNNNVKPGNLRFISGNVLTGTKISMDGFLGFYDSQVTVIPEGDYYEFFGWIKPGFNKFSFYKIFGSKVLPRRGFRLDTNLHGGERAFVLTGNYEKVIPMDIYPMQLLKAILAEDIELMENLGIYEVSEEDFALCEFIDVSKIEIQSIIRKGIDLIKKEMS